MNQVFIFWIRFWAHSLNCHTSKIIDVVFQRYRNFSTISNSRNGEALFYSENVSTISIIKDFISKKATEKKVILNINLGNFLRHRPKTFSFFHMATHLETNPDSTAFTLRCIHPMIDYHMVLAKKVHLIDALKVSNFRFSSHANFKTSR